MVTGEQKVSEIAQRSTAMREILHRYGVDLCCGGVHPLSMAAQAHGVDLQRILSELNAVSADEDYDGGHKNDCEQGS